MSAKKTVIQAIFDASVAIENCGLDRVKEEWRDRWLEYRKELIALLPRGSGFDAGTKFVEFSKQGEWKKTEVIRFETSFHHMDEHGYNGWSEHTVTVRPSFSGIRISISGRDRNEIKDYIYEVFHDVLTSEAPEPSWAKVKEVKS